MNPEISLSIVVPVLNEAENVAKLHSEIVAACKKTGRTYEIIFVNDGSSDGTRETLESLSPITVINFRKNFGQTSALDAGIKAAKGEFIIALDGDGQDDPAEIPKLLQHLLDNNLDVVSSWRKNRKDKKNKRIASLIAARFRKFLINDGIHDSGCTFKVYRRECFENIDLYGEMHRFIPAVLKIKGFTVGEVVVNHRLRMHGVTKYNWKRGVKGILDMLSVWFWKKFANRPLHLFGGAGVVFIFLGASAFGFVLIQSLFFGKDISDTALTIISLLTMLTGVQLFVFGLLADILSKNYFATSRDTPYVIKDVVTKDE